MRIKSAFALLVSLPLGFSASCGSSTVSIDPGNKEKEDHIGMPEPLLYQPVPPCRIVDTRKTSAGRIRASTQRTFLVSGSGDEILAQGGSAPGCPSPVSGEAPVSVHVNIVAANAVGKGNLQAFPPDSGPGAGLSVNYNTIDTNLANAGTVGTTNEEIELASNHSSAHAVIDVLGYYYPADVLSHGGLRYDPIEPCRIVDTRKTLEGYIGASTHRRFRVFGSGSAISAQGGNSAGCASPIGEPLAAHINMIAVSPTGKGNLQAFPLGAGTGAGLSVNYNTIDTNLANAGTVKTIPGAGPDITVASNFASAHTVIDVLGYYHHTADLSYSPVTPCRIVDTRNTSAGRIGASTQRNFFAYGSGSTIRAQGGNSAGCASPIGEPLAAHINMVAVSPTGKGNLQAFPLASGTGAGLSVNYNTIDTNLANAGTVKTITGTGPDITVASNFASAHTVIDVLGYYFRNHADFEIRVKSISFRYPGSDAIALYDNINTRNVSPPEYDSVAGVQGAAWIMGGAHSVDVEFQASDAIHSAEVWAAGGLGGLRSTSSAVTVTFSGGIGHGTFRVNSPPSSIGKHLFDWNWYYKNLNHASTPTTSMGTTGKHLLYTVYGTPNAPMTTPWLSVIDSASIWAQGQATATDARTAITAGLNSIADLDGDVDYNPTSFYTSGTLAGGFQFHLTGFLRDLETRMDMEVNCADSANALQVYQNALGLDIQYRILGIGDNHTNYIDPIGNGVIDDPTYPVEDWQTTWWPWHAVGWLSGEIIYDATLHLDGDGTPSARPNTRLAPVNIDTDTYCDLLTPPTVRCDPEQQNICSVY
ncbi:hypothetical protein ACFL6C_05335 [Myxococcota bacterium]